mmetsp:Transcript_5695/g.14416  ORF Transcript_5695/g.14416 Transcript_5695/m.14416 type:complete len:411 (-) Transcript_5695:111-1343(-)
MPWLRTPTPVAFRPRLNFAPLRSLPQPRLPHAVLLGAVLEGAVLAAKGVLDLDVQVARVVVVGPCGDCPAEPLALADSDGLLQVEHRLLPVGRAAAWRGGKAALLVARAKIDVKVDNKRMDVVVAGALELEGRREGAVVLHHLGDVKALELARLGDHLLLLHTVHQRLAHRNLPDARHVKAVHVAPEVDLLLLVLRVLDCHDRHGGRVREHEAARREPLVAGIQHGIKHGLVQQKVAHPLADNDVHLVHRQLRVLQLLVHNGHAVLKPVDAHNLLRLLSDRGALDAVHMLGARLGRKQAEDARATADIHHDLVLEQKRVLHDGVVVRPGAHLVLDHLLMDAKVCIRVEVVVRTGLIILRHGDTGYGFPPRCCAIFSVGLRVPELGVWRVSGLVVSFAEVALVALVALQMT